MNARMWAVTRHDGVEVLWHQSYNKAAIRSAQYHSCNDYTVERRSVLCWLFDEPRFYA